MEEVLFFRKLLRIFLGIFLRISSNFQEQFQWISFLIFMTKFRGYSWKYSSVRDGLSEQIQRQIVQFLQYSNYWDLLSRRLECVGYPDTIMLLKVVYQICHSVVGLLDVLGLVISECQYCRIEERPCAECTNTWLKLINSLRKLNRYRMTLAPGATETGPGFGIKPMRMVAVQCYSMLRLLLMEVCAR